MIPGIYKDLAMAEYHKRIGLSKTGMVDFCKAPILYYERYHLGLIKKETQAMRRGKAFHALQDGTFPILYAIGPEVKSRSEKKWKDFVASNPGKVCLKPSEAAELIGMTEAVRLHRKASEILKQPGDDELSFYWIDAITGILLKCRPDRITADFDIVVDFKTAADPTPDAFRSSAYDRHYYVSAALTLEGIEAATGKRPSAYYYLAVSPTRPYLVGLYKAMPDEIKLGQEFIRSNLMPFKLCQDSDSWPGLPDEVIPNGLPRRAHYELKAIEREHEALNQLIS